MPAVVEWAGSEGEPVPSYFPASQRRVRGRRTAARIGELPAAVEAAISRGTELGSAVSAGEAAVVEEALPVGGAVWQEDMTVGARSTESGTKGA